MSKVISNLCMISLIFFLTLSYVVARQMTTFPDVTPMEIYRKDNEVERVNVEDRCKGLKEEECLMRRTLEAHLDYIYTQKNKQP